MSGPGPRRSGRLLALAVGLAGLLLGSAGARTVKIVTAERLELRQLDDQEIVVISGKKVELHVDEDVILATRVEYNRTRRTLTLVGAGEYDSVQNGVPQVLRGSDLVVELATQSLSGQDVLISDADLEIRGEAVERVPGQLSASNGSFTPCAKCGRTPNDYAFRAKSILLYPGDRLVGYAATLLLAGAPVLYLPVVVLPLQEQSRQPRLDIAQDAVDGLSVQAALPFVIGGSTLGTSLLRYYQNRSPGVGLRGFGVGVDLHSYGPFLGVDRLDLYALANPRPLLTGSDADGNPVTTVQPGFDYDLNFSVRGRFPLPSSVAGLSYALTAVRSDLGRADTDPQRGVTDVSGTAGAEYPDFSVGLVYRDRFGPPPTSALPTPLRRPEVTFDPKPYRLGNLSADFRVTVGNYTAASNPLSRSASAQGPNFSTVRLEENHVLSYTTRLWKGADLTLNNAFTGRYYLTGARVVDLSASAALTQTFSVGNSLRLNYVYLRQEGTSPFAFDTVYSRRLSGVLSTDLTLTPSPGFSVTVSQPYDFVQPASKQLPATFGVRVQKEPVSVNLTLKPNFFTRTLESADLDAVVGQNKGLTVGLRGGYTASGGPGPLSLSLDAVGGVRTNTFGVTLTYDLAKEVLSSLNLRAAAVSTRDTVLNPVSFNASETITLATPGGPASGGGQQTPGQQTPGQPAGFSGSATLNVRDLVFSVNHAITLPAGNPSSDRISFGIARQPGSLLSWGLTYGGTYDLARGGFPNPALTATLTASRPRQRLSAQASVNLPGLDQTRTELSSASVAGSYDFGRAALTGSAYYSRVRAGTDASASVTDTLSFQPLTLTLALGNGPRPGAYLSTTLRQTFSWKDGQLQGDGRLLPILLLTVDRCCWAFQVELNPLDQRYRIGVSLPGAGDPFPAFEATPAGTSVPLLRPAK